MKIAVISFTDRGNQLNRKLTEGLRRAGHSCVGYVGSRSADSGELQQKQGSLKEWTEQQFEQMDGIIFIGACGIAVRSIAPFVRDKFTDPAVLVIDEAAGYVISLLSGHVGGANRLARLAARISGAVPVISTATDVNGRFAVDEFAVQNGLWIEKRRLAKQVSSAILSGEEIDLVCEGRIEGAVPEELHLVSDKTQEEAAVKAVPDIRIGVHQYPWPSHTLYLIPRSLYLGIGCRKGTEPGLLEAFILETLEQNRLFLQAFAGLATITVKEKEPAIAAFCEKYGLQLSVFTAEELAAVPGEFSASSFVAATVGVDNVCERSAVLAASNGSLMIAKKKRNGMTLAVAARDWRVRFE